MNILVIRLSAMGDVAMSVYVLKALSEQYPRHKIFMITNKFFNPFFDDIPNITLINPDLKGKHNGIFGLYRLFKEIKKDIKPGYFIDIHDILRTKILRFFFRLSGTKTVKINKSRKEKKQLTRNKNKILKPLKHTVERYTDTFSAAGISLKVSTYSILKKDISDSEISNFLKGNKTKIGIAPFAKHPQKQYPIKKTEELITKLSNRGYKIFLFGGGSEEKKIAEIIAEKHQNTISLIGKLSLSEEMQIINNLDIMITPDSGNMHIAALTSVKIISIWGATHPFAGFTPYTNSENSVIIQNEKLTCRPCSVFGNKPCYKQSSECLNSIEVDEIISAITKLSKS